MKMEGTVTISLADYTKIKDENEAYHIFLRELKEPANDGNKPCLVMRKVGIDLFGISKDTFIVSSGDVFGSLVDAIIKKDETIESLMEQLKDKKK